MKNAVHIVERVAEQTARDLLVLALDRSGFWEALTDRCQCVDKLPASLRILIKPDLSGFAVNSPVLTAPSLVEALIDELHDRGFTQVDVCGGSRGDLIWAENREPAVIADLVGYQYQTPGGRDYDVIDLTEELVESGVGPTRVLGRTSVSKAWMTADVRILFASNKTDLHEGYALNLEGLLDVLPQPDVGFAYQQTGSIGEIIQDLLEIGPISFALIDAVESAHGEGGRRVPLPIETNCIFASGDVAAADFVAAMKMGLDPYVSPLAAAVYRAALDVSSLEINGSVNPYLGWRNVDPLVMAAQRQASQDEVTAQLTDPWLQQVDTERFPVSNLVDGKINGVLRGPVQSLSQDPSKQLYFVWLNFINAGIAYWRQAYRVLFDKDLLARQEVSLGLDAEDFADTDYAALRSLDSLQTLLTDAEPATAALRWRQIDGTTLFEYHRTLPIPFDVFVESVSVHKTIQFMSDYIGGCQMTTKVDDKDRPIHLLERNLYLPQPNYLALYQGKPIDVSKIEYCRYEPNRHAMYWKTLKSENDSATYDDGIVTFDRSVEGVRIRIVGKQLFTLPPLWQMLDLNLLPELRSFLVTHAYTEFFDRTMANFEAIVEGREIRIGKSQLQLTTPPQRLMDRLVEFGTQVGEEYGDVLAALGDAFASPASVSAYREDEAGFRHFSGVAEKPAYESPQVEGARLAVERYFNGLRSAIERDIDSSVSFISGS